MGEARSSPDRYWLLSSRVISAVPPDRPRAWMRSGGQSGRPRNSTPAPRPSRTLVSSPMGRSCMRPRPRTSKSPCPAAATATIRRQVVPDSPTSSTTGSASPPRGRPATPATSYSPPWPVIFAPMAARQARVRSRSWLSSTPETRDTPSASAARMSARWDTDLDGGAVTTTGAARFMMASGGQGGNFLKKVSSLDPLSKTFVGPLSGGSGGNHSPRRGMGSGRGRRPLPEVVSRSFLDDLRAAGHVDMRAGGVAAQDAQAVGAGPQFVQEFGVFGAA